MYHTEHLRQEKGTYTTKAVYHTQHLRQEKGTYTTKAVYHAEHLRQETRESQDINLDMLF